MTGVAIAAAIIVVACVASGIVGDWLRSTADRRKQADEDRQRHASLMRELRRHDNGPTWRR